MSRIRRVIPGVDPKLLIKDATKLMPDPTRRLFLRGGASLGALAFLTGCDIIDGPSAEQVLTKISYFNDRAQAWLFNPNRLAPTYPGSAIGKWSGTRLSEFLRRVGADLTAKYVWFRCAEGYHTSIDMPTALHPQTQMTFKFDGEILPTKYGFPMKVRIPTKLGFKNPKHVMELAVINNWNPGYWEEKGYNWFSGV